MTNKSTVNQRMQQIVDSKFDGKRAAFAKSVGIPPTSMSNYFKKQSAIPSAEILEKIVNAVDVNAYWLLTGKGDMNQPNKACHRSAPDVPRIKVSLELDLTMEEIKCWGLEDKISKMLHSNNELVQQTVQQPSLSSETPDK